MRESLFWLRKKETLSQICSCRFSKISKNAFFTEHLWTATSGLILIREIFIAKPHCKTFPHTDVYLYLIGIYDGTFL